ncbi:homoserine kinase [Gordonia hirsuta DSM 44140 = NBRC 16056]|uniref:Homoserine kinase n=1 Tax=Gordonia hirsuta DSM 44140 = NBRC 16056 TaxID=1121927 RepID=L7L790_9ACTN|nr:homoserine kinase [Gordonia hirsuta]GAC56804.1 homoserine kinase [Gordonia hirsuta DSM 44140 = NBRC 16056]
MNATPTAPAGAPDAQLRLTPGQRVQVRVPASTANLGPGFDCLGLALGIYDTIAATVTEGDVVVEATGEGAHDVPRDGTHLVARALIRGLQYAGISAPGLHLHCTNMIPHSRGLGSSAAAVVGGLVAASALMAAEGLRSALSETELVQLSGEFEGHPDNAAASVLGGPVVTWMDGEGGYFARRVHLHPAITATAFVPQTESSTAVTRGLLPHDVPRADAVFNLSRSALAVVALTSDPSCLFDATADRLHQDYRAPAMPQTHALVTELRSGGHAATVSGAGPSVVVLGTEPLGQAEAESAAAAGFTMTPLAIGEGVTVHT